MPGYTLDVQQMQKDAETGSVNNEATATAPPAGGGDKQQFVPRSVDASDWNILAQALDRILFVLYLLIIIFYPMTYVGSAVSTSSSSS